MTRPSLLFSVSQWEGELLASFDALDVANTNEGGVLQHELIAHTLRRFNEPMSQSIVIKARKILKNIVQRGSLREERLANKGKPIVYHRVTSLHPVQSTSTGNGNARSNGRHTGKFSLHRADSDDDFSALPDGSEEEERDSRDALDRYFRDVRKYPVQRRKKEIQWFTELDGLWRKIIACLRLSNSARALAKICTISAYLQDGSGDDDEYEEKRQEELEWLRFWWHVRNWQKIDCVVASLEHIVSGNNGGHPESAELSHVLSLIAPFYERAAVLRHEIAQHNLRLVIHAARIYQGSDMYSDVIQEGNKGLLRAVDKFVVAKGNKFVTYAMWWARQHIIRYAAQRRGVVTFPAHISEYAARMKKAEDRFRQEHGRSPSVQELALILGVDADMVHSLLATAKHDVSLSQTVGPDGDTALENFFKQTSEDEADAVAKANDMKKLIATALEYLPPKLAKVIDIRYGLTTGEGHSLEDTADLLMQSGYPHLSRERIRQLETQAFRKMKYNRSARQAYEEIFIH